MSYVVRQQMMQLICTMFISNNRALFYLWWKENLVKYLKVSKYYLQVCLQKLSVLKALELPKLSNKSRLKRSGASEKEKDTSRENHRQNTMKIPNSGHCK